VIGVHGRTREMKGQQTGLADLQKIREVRDHVGGSVPVIENGNVLTFADVQPNLETSGCQAVMSAEALLWDPRLFSNPTNPVLTGRNFHCTQNIRFEAIQTAKEYLAFVATYPVELGFAKGHLFKILYHSYELFQDMRMELGDFECTDGNIAFLIDHVKRLESLEREKGIYGALVKTTTAEKRAAKDAVQEAAVEEAESYFIDFSSMM
jgi:tRNA-dihydrouridine synthase 1